MFLEFSMSPFFILGQNSKCAIDQHLKSRNCYLKSRNGYLKLRKIEEVYSNLEIGWWISVGTDIHHPN